MSQQRTLSEIAAHLREVILQPEVSREPRQSLAGDEQFSALALEVFAAQFRTNAVYRKLCTSRGATPSDVSSWTNIPTVPTSGFKEFELTCLAEGERIAEFHSSGTTGHKPSRHFHSRESLELYEASLWAWFRRHLLPNHGRHATPELLLLTPPPEETANSSLVYMFETVRKRLGAPPSSFLGSTRKEGWTLDRDGVVNRLASLASPTQPPRPILLLGTAISWLEIMDFMAARKQSLRLPPASRVMETGGYKGRTRTVSRDQLHSLISRHLGVPMPFILSEYGMSELSSQAYTLAAGPVRVATKSEPNRERAASPPNEPSMRQRAEGHLFRFPPWARARIISPETGREVAEGETGLIQVFDLANVFSVMAIQTEDLAIKRENGFQLLGRAEDVEPRGCSLHAANSP